MFSNSEKTDMLLILGKCDKNVDAAVRLYARQYPNRKTPSNSAFRKLEKNLREFGQFKKMKVRNGTVTTPVNEAALMETVAENPHVNQKQISRQMEISLVCILKANRFHPYHITIVQHLRDPVFSSILRSFIMFLSKVAKFDVEVFYLFL